MPRIEIKFLSFSARSSQQVRRQQFATKNTQGLTVAKR